MKIILTFIILISCSFADATLVRVDKERNVLCRLTLTLPYVHRLAQKSHGGHSAISCVKADFDLSSDRYEELAAYVNIEVEENIVCYSIITPADNNITVVGRAHGGNAAISCVNL